MLERRLNLLLELRVKAGIDIHVLDRNETLALDIQDALVLIVETAWRTQQGFATELEVSFETTIAHGPLPIRRFSCNSSPNIS